MNKKKKQVLQNGQRLSQKKYIWPISMENTRPTEKWENTYKSDILLHIYMLKIGNSHY